MHALSELKETNAVITLDDESGLQGATWSEDGQLMAVASLSGELRKREKLSVLSVNVVSRGSRSAYVASICVMPACRRG